MNTFHTGWRLAAIFVAMTASTPLIAQEPAPSRDVKPMCNAVTAKILVSKVGCSAAQCNTAAPETGFVGLLSKVANKGMGNIDASMFSVAMGSQLATSLKQTGCFEVLDAVSIEEIRKEMEALGRPAPPPQNFDYIVKSTVTKADMVVEESGILMYKKTSTTSTLALDIKLVHAENGNVIEAAIFDAVQKSASGVSVGGIYSSGDDATKKGNPFADIGREVTAKAAVGIANKVIAQAATKAEAPK
ncbi:MAG: hypothetical protein RLZZ584_3636 [Pseudomonadota bacterium]|jgi:curli biogenesis system outer membrane secretion channel CsgG